MRRVLTCTFAVVALTACRPDPGVPDYSGLADVFGDGGASEFKPGPYPYVEGTRRLAFGIFYEGGASDRLPLDDYYIFNNTYASGPSDVRIEGLQSDQFDFNGSGFWGGGIFWKAPTDMRGWTRLHVSLNSSDPGLAVIALRALYFGRPPSTSEFTVTVRANDYGWVNDGQWHSLSVPLADFVNQGLDLSRMRSPFTIGNDPAGGTAKLGETLLIDDLYVD